MEVKFFSFLNTSKEERENNGKCVSDFLKGKKLVDIKFETTYFAHGDDRVDVMIVCE
ncbi:MAG: hypothetical protein ACRDDY_04010 [Clostridium sp.]|uniref:hypothetical protein n=1 Tax=Clostridium sp. TaxID=1506 RepID=UPI003EE49802